MRVWRDDRGWIEPDEVVQSRQPLVPSDTALTDLIRAARNLLMYKYCIRDSAGREETDEGLQRALAQLQQAIDKVQP